MKNNLEIIKPSSIEVKKYLKKWDSLEDYTLQESSLKKLFTKIYPLNHTLDDVLVKVCALNQFYSTNIRHIFILSKHIVSLNIDEELKNKSFDIVDKIASGHGIHTKEKSKESYLYSFATKYCSHHNPIDYPIYDSYVKKILIYFRDKDIFFVFKNEDLKQYKQFREILLNFRKYYDLEMFNLKEIDRYLWQAGKEYFPKNYRNKLIKNIYGKRNT